MKANPEKVDNTPGPQQYSPKPKKSKSTIG